MKNIYLLGCTGSIGIQTLEVIRTLEDIKVKSISFGSRKEEAKEIIEEFKPEFVSCLYEEDAIELKALYPNIQFAFGDEGLVQVATYNKEDKEGYLVNAVVGMIGLKPTIEAIKINRNILLANKETLVVGGEIIKDLLKEYNVKMLPIDSEHSAILQCLDGKEKYEIDELIITASGGAFRDKQRSELLGVTINDALAHPNWSMGKKITVDCATMVNKGLEVIEAHYLFDMPYDKIKTIIHRESIVHSMVKFKDGSIIAQMGKPDMRLPIQYAITYPNKKEFKLDSALNMDDVSNLSFQKMDFERYPMLDLAYQVGKMGGIMPIVYNSTNEACVKLFIDNKIKFLDIELIICKNVEKYKKQNILKPTLEQILKLDRDIKEAIYEEYL